MKPIRDWLLQKSSSGTIVLLSVALGASLAGRWDRPTPVGAADHTVSQAEQHSVLETIQDAFTSLADRVEPTVVSIEAIHTVSPAANQDQPDGTPFANPFGDSPFAPFFRQFGTPGRPHAERAGGSGIIVREHGNEAFVLTNDHVVDGANRLTVKLQDGQSYPARLVGTDTHSDLAVLRFDAGHPLGERYLAQLGNSDQVRVGQWAIAIGSPLGYDTTLTTGVISAKGRELDDVEGTKDYRGLIQTDASINPGNSGGPLVNIDGQVVGINVAIASPTGSSIGLGFAIPVNRAKRVMEDLISTGKVTRGFLGIETSRGNQVLSDELKNYYGVKDGALVESVNPGSPAATAGLKSEDVITAFDDQPIHNFGDLADTVAATPPGKHVRVDFVRAHHPMSVTVTLETRKSDAELAKGIGRLQPQQEAAPATPNAFGFTVVPGAEGGAVVGQITPGSAAEDAGLAPGDTILSLGGVAVHDLASWQHALAASTANAVVLKVRRAANGMTSILVLRKS